MCVSLPLSPRFKNEWTKTRAPFLNNTFFVVVAFSLRSRASGDTALSYVCCVHACMSVGVHRGHVRWDAWWWIRAGTNVLVHLWNENQGKGDRRRRAPSHSHQASCRHNLTLFDDLMANTQTKAYFFALYIFPLSFFLPLRKPAQNRSDRRTIHRLAWSARHVWPHCQKRRPWMRWADTHKKIKHNQYLCWGIFKVHQRSNTVLQQYHLLWHDWHSLIFSLCCLSHKWSILYCSVTLVRPIVLHCAQCVYSIDINYTRFQANFKIIITFTS